MGLEQRPARRPRNAKRATELVSKHSHSKGFIWRRLAKPAEVWVLCYRRARNAAPAMGLVEFVSAKLLTYTFLLVREVIMPRAPGFACLLAVFDHPDIFANFVSYIRMA